MKKTVSTEAAGCRMDGTRDAKKEILAQVSGFHYLTESKGSVI
jgi:hypothetical protein